MPNKGNFLPKNNPIASNCIPKKPKSGLLCKLTLVFLLPLSEITTLLEGDLVTVLVLATTGLLGLAFTVGLIDGVGYKFILVIEYSPFHWSLYFH